MKMERRRGPGLKLQFLLNNFNTDMIRAIIIDDESKARDLLNYLLEESPYEIEVLGMYETLLDGVNGIKKHNPDVVFLDIEMPEVSGVKILDFIPDPEFSIVFVTAYDNYAVRAFELSALDYLLKPINREKLHKSIEKLHREVDMKSKLKIYDQNTNKKAPLKICIPSSEENYFIEVNTILAVEANRSYCFIHTLEKKYILSRPLSDFEQKYLPLDGFERVHRSWIVNTNLIQSFIGKNKEVQLNNGMKVPVSRSHLDKIKALGR